MEAAAARAAAMAVTVVATGCSTAVWADLAAVAAGREAAAAADGAGLAAAAGLEDWVG